MRFSLIAVSAAIAVGLAGCDTEDAPPAPARPEAAGDTAAWSARLLRIAKSFPALGRVDDGGRMAPTDCAMPSYPGARLTASKDEETHGGSKLYSIFAKDPKPYRGLTGVHHRRAREESLDVDGTEGCSQVLVKEAYAPVELTKTDSGWVPVDPTQGPLQPIAPATKDGKHLGAGKRIGLFVMFRLDPATPGTDDGWVYGTLDAEGKAVTGIGRVASCASCHAKAPHGRLFGLPK